MIQQYFFDILLKYFKIVMFDFRTSKMQFTKDILDSNF